MGYLFSKTSCKNTVAEVFFTQTSLRWHKNSGSCVPVIAAFGKQTERRGCTRPLCFRLAAALWPHCRCLPSALQRMLQKPVTA
jgi:hypothetical protein